MTIHQAQAILMGLALGDALGYPTEFITLDAKGGIKDRYGDKGIQEPPNPALYTDDTQMTIALTEGLLEAGIHAPIDAQMSAVGKHFVQWAHSPQNNRAPGTTCMRGVANLERGLSWRESGIANSKGCGSAMRVATIGYLYQQDETRLRQIAELSGKITHAHPTAIASSIAGAYLVKLALDGVPTEAFLARVLAFTDNISDEFTYALMRVGHVLSWGSEERALKHLGEGWTGEEAIALALYCVMRYPDDYVKAVCRGANSDGDSDSIACIAGGIMGARLGLEAIPTAWRTRCENETELMELGQRMAEARNVKAS